MSQIDIRKHLDLFGVSIRSFLGKQLPGLGDDWWQKGVLNALSYQQIQNVRERGWGTLDQLDLASLIRVADRNWDFFRQTMNLSFEARNWLKEALSVRNRNAHLPPDAPIDPKRDYRDLDTLVRLVEVLHPESSELAQLLEGREIAFVAASGGQVRSEPESTRGLAPGSFIRLVAQPKVKGVVIGISDGIKERQVRVFHDGITNTYFESQIEIEAFESGSQIPIEELLASITAATLSHPSSSHLFSFNSGRIEYEPYQFRPVMKLISADRPRLLIADDVGVGKTIEAGLIIKELQARQPLDSVLVICPKQLVVENKWRNELRRFDEDFVELDSGLLRYCLDEARLEGQWPGRYRKAILPYSLLDERLLLGAEESRLKKHGLLALNPPIKFDLVIVDEAHHVRNTDTWRHRVVKHFLANAEAAVLISATPIQTSSNDLFNLLQLLRPDVLFGPADFERMREPNAFIARAEEIARSGREGWQAEALKEFNEALGTTWGSAVMTADPRSQRLRELLEETGENPENRINAVRSLQSLNTFSGLINRTRRRDIGAFTVRSPETVEVEFTQAQMEVHSELLDICSRIVGNRQPNMSVEFLLSTLKRQASSCINGLAPFISDLLESRLSSEELSEADLEGEWSAPDTPLGFRSEIQGLAVKASLLEEDPKLSALLAIISEKQRLDNNKLLVFSTFRHTLGYLLPRLKNEGVRVGLVHGAVKDDDRREIRSRFALDRREPDALDVLLSSEVGTEGLDNQFCDALVNYDIPWNPMRIEQRIGRIDRRGQKSEVVSIKNLIVRDTIDAKVYHRCLERIGVFRQALGGSEEIMGELTREMRAIADDLTLSEAQRDKKLQQLADNKLARVVEQSELEQREASLFGLTVQKSDDLGVESASSLWLKGPQLVTLVKQYLALRGFKYSETVFARPVAVLRPDKELRAALLADARDLKLGVSAATSWMRWLENDSDASRRLTFDPQLATGVDVELLNPTHPLLRAAAELMASRSSTPEVSLKIQTDDIPPGRYPFAIHCWKTLGIKNSQDIRVLTLNPSLDKIVERLLPVSMNGDAIRTDDEMIQIKNRHYELWANLRAEHVEQTQAHTRAQLASLQLSHKSRIAQIEDQLIVASHENIKRMKESELKSAEADFGKRKADLESSIDRCDVVSTELCIGILEVI